MTLGEVALSVKTVGRPSAHRPRAAATSPSRGVLKLHINLEESVLMTYVSVSFVIGL